MKKKRISAFFLTIALLSGSLSSTAYAATWYMEDGDVVVSASENGQTVSQNNNTVEDNDPTFTNRHSDTASDSTITITTSDDATANITIEDINLKHSYDSSIDVKGDSKADITVRGTNTINRRDESSSSMIHVSDGDLTLRGDGSLTLSGYTDGAKIGSNGYSGNTGQGEEDFTGSIHITDNVTVSATRDPHHPSDTGSAAIGSGEKGNFTGTITIDGNAKVTADATWCGPGIGCGEKGDYNGDIIIGGNAEVAASGGSASAAIGSGWDGTFSGGTITIKDNAEVTAIGSNGFSYGSSCSNPAIGASEKANPDYNPDKAPMNGTITITDNAQVKIGGDDKFGTSKTPLIGEASSEPTGTGKIEISGNATVSNVDGSSDIAIGGGTASSTIDISIGANTNINGTKGSDILESGGSSNVQFNTVKTPTLAQESTPTPAPAAVPAASVSNGSGQTESSAVSTESFCHSVTLSLPSAGLSNVSFCPACGKKDGKDFLTPVSDVSAQAVTGTLPAGAPVLCIGTLDNGVGIMSAAVIKHHRAVQPTGIVRFTVPASLLAGHRLVALHADGTQTEIMMTLGGAQAALPAVDSDAQATSSAADSCDGAQSALSNADSGAQATQTLSFDINFAANGNDNASPVRMVLLLPEAS